MTKLTWSKRCENTGCYYSTTPGMHRRFTISPFGSYFVLYDTDNNHKVMGGSLKVCKAFANDIVNGRIKV